MSESSWIEDSDSDETALRFDLPATDSELVDQVVDFLVDDPNAGDMLLNMSRKYRFAGYIGSIEHLCREVSRLKDEIRQMKKNSWSTYLNRFFKVF